MVVKPTSLPYMGGKAVLAPWINSLLPPDYRVTYIEPYGGQTGVLLYRGRSEIEIVNDLNDRLINWLRTIRRHKDEFIALLELTPQWSHAEFMWAMENADNPDLSMVERAMAYFLWITNSRVHSDSDEHRRPSVWKRQAGGKWWEASDIELLHNRLKRVILSCEDGAAALERVAHKKDVIAYVDPPYYSIDRIKEYYRHAVIDVDHLTKVLKMQRGRVLLSGYDDEWDHLGWERHVKQHSSQMASDRSGRKEVAWANYVIQPVLL